MRGKMITIDDMRIPKRLLEQILRGMGVYKGLHNE
jgi:hypothetical protein